MKTRKKINEKGQLLVELILIFGLATAIFPAITTGFLAVRAGRAQKRQRLQATILLQQVISAAKKIRNNDWTTFSIDGTYHPVITNNTWIWSTGATTANGFTGQAMVSDAYRDSNGITTQTNTSHLTLQEQQLQELSHSAVLVQMIKIPEDVLDIKSSLIAQINYYHRCFMM